ncbi:MAG: DoxX family membrane protein [Austwickia sp.]|nr:DoxX family membrane protein [Austwickia sp.]MCO5309709.1 DoxX family membrane protein [Austwickia sp.]
MAVPWVRWIGLAARLILAGVWIYAAATKLGKPLTSARSVQAYDIFPYDVAAIIGQALPIVELALGILLLIGLFVRPVAIVSAVLLVLFIAGIASAWARGLRIDCGCFGGDGSLAWDREPAYLQEILRDLGFLALAAWLALRPRTPVAVDNRLNGSGSARAATTASPAGVGTGTTP